MERKRQRLAIRRAGLAAVLLGARRRQPRTSDVVPRGLGRGSLWRNRRAGSRRSAQHGDRGHLPHLCGRSGELRVEAFPPEPTMSPRRSVPSATVGERRSGAGQALRLDIQMEDGETLNTPGEFYFRRAVGNSQAAKRRARPSARPTSPVSGFHRRIRIPSRRQYCAAEAQRKQRFASGVTPRSLCLPTGIVLTRNRSVKFVQTPNLLVILVEGGDPGFRQIFLDGRAHPKDPFPTWQGHSVGRWEGDTLVVDTVGFNDRVSLTLAEHPQTEKMHVVERFRRPDLGRLEIEYARRPSAYSKPWKVRTTLARKEGLQVRVRGEQQGDGARGGLVTRSSSDGGGRRCRPRPGTHAVLVDASVSSRCSGT